MGKSGKRKFGERRSGWGEEKTKENRLMPDEIFSFRPIVGFFGNPILGPLFGGIRPDRLQCLVALEAVFFWEKQQER